MKTNPTPMFILLCLLPAWLTAQTTFTDQTNLLTDATLTSGCAMGIADMNGDGLDDIIRLRSAHEIEIAYQTTPNATFTDYIFGDLGTNKEWSISIADVDHNGYNDIFAGGPYNGLKLLLANSTGTAFTQTAITGGGSIFVQSSSFADINNDGYIDLFPCHDDGLNTPYEGDGTGSFTFNAALINTATNPVSDNSGNYGTIWMDYDADGDLDMYLSKCRENVTNPNDLRRINMLFENDGNGNYTDVAQAVGLRPLGQTWAADFGDIDNDGDWDCYLINHDIDSEIYTYDATTTPVYTEHTTTAGLDGNIPGGGIQVKFVDFDNDGFIDLLVTGIGGHRLFMNDSDGTFTPDLTAIPDTYSDDNKRIHSAAVGDLNNDGFLDIYAGYAHSYNNPQPYPDRLFMNEGGNGNNYLKVRLKGIADTEVNKSNVNGIGATLELHGAWGMQMREMRSGEGYSVVNSLTQHFGIGTATEITKLVVKWPSGIVDEILNPGINQTLLITEEGGITLPLTLLDFSAQATKTHNQITWTSSEAFGMKYFVVECSQNAKDFETVEQVIAQNDRHQQTYTVHDKQATSSTFYRLKMVEKNGQSTYSEMILVERATDFVLHDIVPNPVEDETIQIHFETKQASSVRFSIVNSNGVVMTEQQIMATEGLNQYRLEPENWASGLYFLILKNGEQTLLRKLVVR